MTRTKRKHQKHFGEDTPPSSRNCKIRSFSSHTKVEKVRCVHGWVLNFIVKPE